MTVENTEISPRKKDVRVEEKVVIDAFKQVFLLSDPPAVVPCQGYVSMWQKAPGQAWILAEFETFNGKCYMLPIAGPECSLRTILATLKREGRHDKRPGHSAIFEVLTEGKLIQVLKSFSLIVFTEPNDKTWLRRDENSQKIVALKAEQLAASGRFGRVPLPIVVEKYVQYVFRHGIGIDVHTHVRYGLDAQLFLDHGIKRGTIDKLDQWSLTRRDPWLSGLRGTLTREEFEEAVALATKKGGK